VGDTLNAGDAAEEWDVGDTGDAQDAIDAALTGRGFW
jgi:hypothetical protein